MKREPKPGERALIHSTEQTGDVQSLALCDENFNPGVLRKMAGMRRGESLMGYSLLLIDPGQFVVIRDEDGERLTRNTYGWAGGDVRLHTKMLSPRMSPEEAAMLADLEQCAALVLLDEEAL